jgi:16S rRNA (uracil1498-N3)-methyltransferase
MGQRGPVQLVVAGQPVHGVKLGRDRLQLPGLLFLRPQASVRQHGGLASEEAGAQGIGDLKRRPGACHHVVQSRIARRLSLLLRHGRTVVHRSTIPAMVRVFVAATAIAAGRLYLSDAEARHLGGSLRLRPGEQMVAVTPDGVEHLCVVTGASAREVAADVIQSSPSRREPALRLRLCQALLKGDQFDRILEYAGELGVDSVQPMVTERTVVRPEPGKLASRADRWRQIVRQGAELGQRGRLPEVLPVASPAEAAAAAVSAGFRVFLLYEGARLQGLSSAELGNDGVCLLTGPEGGWSPAEVELAERSGAVAVSLGPRIMRPLPAVLTAIAVLYHRTGDLQLKED